MDSGGAAAKADDVNHGGGGRRSEAMATAPSTSTSRTSRAMETISRLSKSMFGLGPEASGKSGAAAKGDPEPMDVDPVEEARKRRQKGRPGGEDKKSRMRRMFMRRRYRDPDDHDDYDDDFDFDDFDDFDDDDMFMMMMMRHDRWGDPYHRRKQRQQQSYGYGYRERTPPPPPWRPPAMVAPEDGEDEPLAQVEVPGGAIEVEALRLMEEGEDGVMKCHTAIKLPTLENKIVPVFGTLNVLMADVSGSMDRYWKAVVNGWNNTVRPILQGRTEIYVFSDNVKHIRTDNFLEQRDMIGGMTNLTGALQKVVDLAYTCKEKYVNIFLITDGGHSLGSPLPESVTQIMQEPKGKLCEVFVFGVDRDFPVNLSVETRSNLHNGSVNVPTLFWAKSLENMTEQMADMAKYITMKTKLKLTKSGATLPGMPATSLFHMDELVYFQLPPQDLQDLHIQGNIQLKLKVVTPTPFKLLELFRQWNTVVIQIHNKKQTIPEDLTAFMDRLYKTAMKGSGYSIADRMQRIQMKTAQVEYQTLVNNIKRILLNEGFATEVERAEAILSTTVTTSKYQEKALKMKGHTEADYDTHLKTFTDKLKEIKDSIKDLHEDPCSVCFSSTLADLQDEDFPLLTDLNKFDFLKEFTMTGIPVFAPMGNSVTLNPWTYSIKHMLIPPYATLSQVALENFPNKGDIGTLHKDIELQKDNENTHFNAIIPVFSPETASVMKPLVRTNLYAMCATFAILKNPHIIDHHIHMAALTCAWVRILFDYQDKPRPSFVCERMDKIDATAALYLDRPSYKAYCTTLIENTKQALMTESDIRVDDKIIRSETITKPMFMLHLLQKQQDTILPSHVLKTIIGYILLEYIGRCLNRYTSSNTAGPYTDFFVEGFEKQEEKKEWVKKYVEDAEKALADSQGSLLTQFYTLDEVHKAGKKSTKQQTDSMMKDLEAELPLKLNMQKVEKLRSVSTAGDVSWFTLRSFTKEMGLSTEDFEELFSERSTLVYVAHALRYRSSCDRLRARVFEFEAAEKFVKAQIKQENASVLVAELRKDLSTVLKDTWKTAYFAAHEGLVRPMSKNQIIVEANQRGISVTDTNFDEVYRQYCPDLGLLRNACQCRTCPFFLQPKKNFNQHIAIRRTVSPAYPHAFHLVAHNYRNGDLQVALKELEQGTHRKRNGVGKHIPTEVVAMFSQEMEQLRQLYLESC